MAYDTNELFEQAKKAIQKNDTIFFIEDLVAFLPCSKDTFYKHFPVNVKGEKEGEEADDQEKQSDEPDRYKELTAMLNENKINMKVKIRSQLSKGTKAGELLALYRLICTPEERKMLNQSYIDHTSKGEKLETNINITADAVKDIAKKLEDEF